MSGDYDNIIVNTIIVGVVLVLLVWACWPKKGQPSDYAKLQESARQGRLRPTPPPMPKVVERTSNLQAAIDALVAARSAWNENQLDAHLDAVDGFLKTCRRQPPAPTTQPTGQSGETASDAEIAAEVVQRVCDYDDRNSPEDYPEMLMITGEELRDEVLRALAESREIVEPERAAVEPSQPVDSCVKQIANGLSSASKAKD